MDVEDEGLRDPQHPRPRAADTGQSRQTWLLFMWLCHRHSFSAWLFLLGISVRTLSVQGHNSLLLSFNGYIKSMFYLTTFLFSLFSVSLSFTIGCNTVLNIFNTYTFGNTCEHFCRIAFRSGVCTSGRMFTLHFYKYCLSCLPRRIPLTSRVWECLCLCFFFNLCQCDKGKYIFLDCISPMPFGVNHISSGNCLLLTLPFIFPCRRSLYIRW